MKTIKFELNVFRVELDAPLTRVTGFFYEGGNHHSSAVRTEMSFLVGSFDQPRVGDVLMVEISRRDPA